MRGEQRKAPGLGAAHKHCTPRAVWEQRRSGDTGKEQLLIPRSGSGEENPKVSLASCLPEGQAWKPFIGFIICSNISSFYYVNCIHTYKTTAYLQVFLHTKKEPKCQALSITNFFANTISLIKVFSSFLLPFFHNMLLDSPQISSAISFYTLICIPISSLWFLEPVFLVVLFFSSINKSPTAIVFKLDNYFHLGAISNCLQTLQSSVIKGLRSWISS